MSPADRRKAILEATCFWCKHGLFVALPDSKGKLVHTIPTPMHDPNPLRVENCTANHALADQVESWLVAVASQVVDAVTATLKEIRKELEAMQ